MKAAIRTFVGLIVLSLVPGCGIYKKSKKSKRADDATEQEVGDLTPPDRKTIGSATSGSELALAQFNPAMAHACDGQLQNQDYQSLIDDLGGVRFAQNLNFIRNEAKPYLVKSRYPTDDVYNDSAKSSAADDSNGGAADMETMAESAQVPQESVDIQRADLVGKDGSKVIFLSKTHGLFLVETNGDKPKMSCTTIVPGDAKNFYIMNGHLILVANSVSNRGNAAIIVFQITDAGLTFKSSTLLEKQTIRDSRLFNETLVTYSEMNETRTISYPVDNVIPEAYELSSMSYQRSRLQRSFKVAAFNELTSKPKVIFEDLLNDSNSEVAFDHDYGMADIGKIVSSYSNFNDFISASDRFFVISRQVSKTKIAGIVSMQRTYQYCADYNPHYQEIKNSYCAPQWDRVDNPEFDPNFSCHMSDDFAACVKANESKFIKSYWAYKGSVCQEYSYWIGQCNRYESRTVVNSYPRYANETETQLMVYKYEGGGFIRLDDPSGAEPFVIPGALKEHKSLQFRDGYMMAISTDQAKGTSLRTYKIAEKALVFAGSVGGMGAGEDIKAVLYTDDMAYVVTFLQKDPLFRIDIKNPARPMLVDALTVPGFSSQLISYADKLIGIGTTGDWQHNYVKVSLFDVAGDQFMSEVGSIELGGDLDQSSNNSATDDQLHHWVPSEGRLYVPYQGWSRKAADETFSKVCPAGFNIPRFRLSVLSANDQLREEASFDFRGNIERVLEFSKGHALAFSAGGVNSISEDAGAYKNDDVSELFQTEAIYSDESLPEGMVIAKQTVRAGWQMFKLRFVLGTRDQIVHNNSPYVINISDDMVSCLGDPELQFFDNEMYLGHNLHHVREGYTNYNDRVEVQISGYLGWKIDASGFHEMSEEDIAAYKSKKRTYCWLNDGIGVPKNWEEVSLHETHLNDWYSCKLGLDANVSFVVLNN